MAVRGLGVVGGCRRAGAFAPWADRSRGGAGLARGLAQTPGGAWPTLLRKGCRGGWLAARAAADGRLPVGSGPGGGAEQPQSRRGSGWRRENTWVLHAQGFSRENGQTGTPLGRPWRGRGSSGFYSCRQAWRLGFACGRPAVKSSRLCCSGPCRNPALDSHSMILLQLASLVFFRIRNRSMAIRMPQKPPAGNGFNGPIPALSARKPAIPRHPGK